MEQGYPYLVVDRPRTESHLKGPLLELLDHQGGDLFRTEVSPDEREPLADDLVEMDGAGFAAGRLVLDPAAQDLPQKRANADLGVTLLIIEHNMRAIMNLAEHIYCLAHGQLLAEGPPAEIKDNQRVIDAYLGAH